MHYSLYTLYIRFSISISGISNVWFLGSSPFFQHRRVPPSLPRRRETPAKRGHPKDPPTPPRPPPPPMKAQRRSAFCHGKMWKDVGKLSGFGRLVNVFQYLKWWSRTFMNILNNSNLHVEMFLGFFLVSCLMGFTTPCEWKVRCQTPWKLGL